MAQSAAGFFAYPTGREGAEKLGYDPDLLSSLAPELIASFCGVGNPFSIEQIEPGSAVLDIGCGAGFDLIVARKLAGGSGRVCGIDLTSEMVARAKSNCSAAGFDDVEIKQVEGEAILYPDNTFDVVISNGVINLSPDKEKLFGEIHRALKPGGRLQFADIVLERELPTNLVGSLEAWSQ